jgi:hypothetical protein
MGGGKGAGHGCLWATAFGQSGTRHSHSDVGRKRPPEASARRRLCLGQRGSLGARLPPALHAPLQGLIGLLDAAEAACGRRDQLPALLQGCIAASVEAAFEASLAELSTNVDAGGRTAGWGGLA